MAADLVPNSSSKSTVSTVGKQNGLLDPSKELDAGALFVLKSRGESVIIN